MTAQLTCYFKYCHNKLPLDFCKSGTSQPHIACDAFEIKLNSDAHQYNTRHKSNDHI